jgi:Tol biopolymer transport system component
MVARFGLLLVWFFATGLCGCAGGGNPGTTTTQLPSPTPSPTASPSPAPTATPALLHASVVFTSSRFLDGSDRSTGTFGLWGMNADGSQPTPLSRITTEDAFSPVFSSDGSKVACLSFWALDGSNSGNSALNIWVINNDGSSPKPLTRYLVGRIEDQPAWSPDGTKIAFSSFASLDGSDSNGLTFNIWVINADGTGLQPLTHLTALSADSHNPTWSPDGIKLAFQSRRALDGSDQVHPNGVVNIWTMNSDGTAAAPLTQLTVFGPNFSENPQWSPNGQKILYFSQRPLDGSDTAPILTANIWVTNPDGSGSVPLTTLTQADALLPVWSPDGTRIAYTSSRPLDGTDGPPVSGPNVWVMNTDGSGAVPMTRYAGGTAYGRFPSWTSNTQVVFESTGALNGSNAQNTNGASNIWTGAADGSATEPLTFQVNSTSCCVTARH